MTSTVSKTSTNNFVGSMRKFDRKMKSFTQRLPNIELPLRSSVKKLRD
jgi:hypothetical protein